MNHYSEYVLTAGPYSGRPLDQVPVSVQAAIVRGWTAETYPLIDRRRCRDAVAGDYGPGAIDSMFPIDHPPGPPTLTTAPTSQDGDLTQSPTANERGAR